MGGFANNAPIVTDGLVFYVDAGNSKSYPGSGTTWTDLIDGEQGTLTNGPTYSSNNGGYIDFDGTNDYAAFGVLNLETGTSLCVSAWVTKDNSNYEWIAGRYVGGEDAGWHLIYNSGGFGMNGRSGSGSYRSSGYSSTLHNTGWHHVVGNVNSGVWEIWVDGTLASSTDTGYTNNDFINTDSLSIGETNAWSGNISNVQIYNRALTSAEILQNYNALKNRFV